MRLRGGGWGGGEERPREKRKASSECAGGGRRAPAPNCGRLLASCALSRRFLLAPVPPSVRVTVSGSVTAGFRRTWSVKIMCGFKNLGIPYRFYFIVDCDIPVAPPVDWSEEYENQKYAYSIEVLGVMDLSGRYVRLKVGWSGRNRDAFVFQRPMLRRGMDDGVFVPENPTLIVNDIIVPPLLAPDGAYPVFQWLRIPYRTPWMEKMFNQSLSRAKSVAKWTRLKTWRCLTRKRKIPLAEEKVTSTIAVRDALMRFMFDRA